MKAAATADKSDKGGSIDGTHGDRSGHPRPSRTDLTPAAAVKGSKSPRSVIDPGPSPGRDPHPMTEGMGRAPGGNIRGRPGGTVVTGIGPVSIIVEIFVPGHLRRHVVGRLRVIF